MNTDIGYGKIQLSLIATLPAPWWQDNASQSADAGVAVRIGHTMLYLILEPVHPKTSHFLHVSMFGKEYLFDVTAGCLSGGGHEFLADSWSRLTRKDCNSVCNQAHNRVSKQFKISKIHGIIPERIGCMPLQDPLHCPAGSNSSSTLRRKPQQQSLDHSF